MFIIRKQIDMQYTANSTILKNKHTIFGDIKKGINYPIKIYFFYIKAETRN